MTKLILKNTVVSAVALLLLGGALTLTNTAEARLYKWVDENGNVSYQDRPPPTNHDDTTQVLNSRGITVKRIPGSEEQKKIDAARLVQEKSDRWDKELRDSFPTEEDLLRTRDKRLGLVDGLISRMHDQLVDLNSRLASLDSQIRSRAERKLKPSAALDADRIAVIRGINSTNALIKSKLNERRKIARKFGTDLKRYREIAPSVSATYAE